jgi:hypothetical protein
MENQDLNLWLLKRIQTESSLRNEETRLETVKREYSSERNKYQSARETFQSTRLRLLHDKETPEHPAVRLEKGKISGQKLQADKAKVEIFNQRLSQAETKLKKQSVLVLCNKKKLEVLEERINMILGKKAAKKHFKEELEVLDGKIQQMVLANNKNKASKMEKKENEINTNEETTASEQPVILPEFDLLCRQPESKDFNFELAGSNNFSFEQHHREQSPENPAPETPEPVRDNREFYEQIENLTYSGGGGNDQLNLRYYNKSGHVFELEIRQESDSGLVVNIKPHSKLDALNLNSGKYEIIRNLKARGVKLNRITIRELNNAAK